MRPMLARPLGPKFDLFPCFVQPKLNGVRALYQSGVLQSRDEKLWNYLKVRHIIDELQSFSKVLGKTMLDGELYVHGWRLQRINGAIAVNSDTPRDDTHEVEFHVFDAIDERGFRCNFSERWLDIMADLQNASMPHIKVVITAKVHNRFELDLQFRDYTIRGYEGLMARPDGPYEVGETPHGTQRRSKFLWKLKDWEDGEYRCIGVTPGEGKASIGIGALILDAWKPNIDKEMYGFADAPVPFNVGTGFTDSDRIELMANPPIGKLIRVRYVEKTTDGIPYPCRFEAVMS